MTDDLKKEVAALAEEKGAYKASIEVLKSQLEVYQDKLAELNKVEDAVMVAGAELSNMASEKSKLATDIFKKAKELKVLRAEIKEDLASIDEDRAKYQSEKKQLLEEIGQLKLKAKLEVQ